MASVTRLDLNPRYTDSPCLTVRVRVRLPASRPQKIAFVFNQFQSREISLSNCFGAQVRSPHQRSPSEDSGQDDRRNDNLLRSQALSVIELAVARSHGETHAEDDAVRRVIQAGPTGEPTFVKGKEPLEVGRRARAGK